MMRVYDSVVGQQGDFASCVVVVELGGVSDGLRGCFVYACVHEALPDYAACECDIKDLRLRTPGCARSYCQ